MKTGLVILAGAICVAALPLERGPSSELSTRSSGSPSPGGPSDLLSRQSPESGFSPATEQALKEGEKKLKEASDDELAEMDLIEILQLQERWSHKMQRAYKIVPPSFRKAINQAVKTSSPAEGSNYQKASEDFASWKEEAQGSNASFTKMVLKAYGGENFDDDDLHDEYVLWFYYFTYGVMSFYSPLGALHK